MRLLAYLSGFLLGFLLLFTASLSLAEQVTDEISFGNFKLRDLQGAELANTELRRKKVVLYFWSIYCRGCVSALAELDALRKDLAEEDVELLTIHMFEADVAIISEKVRGLGLDLPILLAPDTTLKSLSIRLLPTSLVFDEEHKLVSRIEGVSDKESLRLNIVAKLNEARSVASAKQ